MYIAQRHFITPIILAAILNWYLGIESQLRFLLQNTCFAKESAPNLICKCISLVDFLREGVVRYGADMEAVMESVLLSRD